MAVANSAVQNDNSPGSNYSPLSIIRVIIRSTVTIAGDPIAIFDMKNTLMATAVSLSHNEIVACMSGSYRYVAPKRAGSWVETNSIMWS